MAVFFRMLDSSTPLRESWKKQCSQVLSQPLTDELGYVMAHMDGPPCVVTPFGEVGITLGGQHWSIHQFGTMKGANAGGHLHLRFQLTTKHLIHGGLKKVKALTQL
jgi:hypothetical protein